MSPYLQTINIRHRLTQVIVFIVVTLACFFFSQVTQAKNSTKPPRFDKPKYRICVHKDSNKVVKILQWKRKNPYQSPLLASNKRSKAKAKPQAETDF